MRYSDDDVGGPIDWDPDDDVIEASGVTITGAHQAVRKQPADDAPPEASLDDWSFVRGTSPDPDLPHWTEAPTGQVPAVLARDAGGSSSDDPWSQLPAPTWREDETDWAAQEERFEPAMLGDEGGAAPVHGDDVRRPWEFEVVEEEILVDATIVSPVVDDDADDRGAPAAPVPPRTARTARTSRPRRPVHDGPLAGRAARPARTAPSRNMPLAIITGLCLGILVLIVFNVSTILSAILCAIVITLGAGEAFSAFRQVGHRPAAALGLVASLALFVAAYNKGISAVPLVSALCFFFTFLWFIAGVEEANVIDGVATTMLVYVWVGVLGAFAGLLLAPSSFPARHGVHFLLGAVILVVANDVGALFFGKLVGSHPFAREISPNKTWEGAVGGAVVTMLLALVVATISGWTTASALTLGGAVCVLAPLGDLCESMFKRSLGVKDMGRALPGHGGLLDRVDGLLFVLPATYYIVLAYHLT